MAEKNNEWFTPAKYVEAAREVMGGMDLDPASCALANQTVKAGRYYSKEDDGLSKPWYGRVWLNPPYGSIDASRKMGLAAFIDRLVNEYQQGNIQQAIALATSRPACRWFAPLWHYPICFVDHDIQFELLTPNRHRYNGKATHIHGSVFVYLGPHEHKFVNTFSEFGRIAKAIDTPRHVEKPIPLWDVERIYA